MVRKVKSDYLPWMNFRVRGQFEIQILMVQLMNITYFTCILKKLNVSLRSFEK